MPEDPVEENPPEIPGMTRIDRPKAPIGEIDQKEQERFKWAVTGWMENPKSTNAYLGISFVYRVVPEIFWQLNP